MEKELNQCTSTYKGAVLNNVALTSLLVPPTEEWQQDIRVTRRYSVAYVTNNISVVPDKYRKIDLTTSSH